MNFTDKTLEYDKVLVNVSDYCRNKYSKNLIMSLRPSTDIEVVNTLLDETEEARTVFYRLGELPIEPLDDVKKYLDLASKGSILEPIHFLDILALINSSNNLKKFFEDLKTSGDIKTPVMTKISEGLFDLYRLKATINLAISKDGKILDGASKDLFQIRRKISQTENRIRTGLNQIMQRENSKLNDLLIVIRNNRMCLPVKIEYKNSFPGIVHDISQSNTTCYIEPNSIIPLANDLEELFRQEEKEIKIILENLSLLVSANYEELINNLEIIAYLDAITAKAKYSKENSYRPEITSQKRFNIDSGKHPLIDSSKVVPISIKMLENTSTIIITGPNTGGKTVSLKTVGLLHMLVQSGIFADAKKSSVFHVFDHILADIGDEQSIEESLSTFSSHITKIINILAEDLSNSLILLDELGSGTDPKEGSSLALAIIEELIKRGSKAIITTHYTDLKNYAYNHEGIVNASVEFNPNTLKPTYRLLLGVPGASNALLIAKNLGLSDEIIENSKFLLAHNKDNKEILDYEKKMSELKYKEDEVASLKESILKMQEDIKKEKQNLESKREFLLQKARRDAENILLKARKDSEALLAEIKELSKNTEIKSHELAKLKHEANTLEVSDKEVIDNSQLAVGDFVMIKSYNQIGTIKLIKKNSYQVNFGQFTMDFKRKDLVKTEKPKTIKIEPKVKASGYNSVAGASMSLDLRGKRYEEVENLVEEFLDKACLANYEKVSIIHGFGTGVVRKRVWEVLKNLPSVKSYRYGKEGEGLNGCTVVELKWDIYLFYHFQLNYLKLRKMRF